LCPRIYNATGRTNNFRRKFPIKLLRSLSNRYGKENIDPDRVGKKRYPKVPDFVRDTRKAAAFLRSSGLSALYRSLEDEFSKDMLLDVLAYRVLGPGKVMLKPNNAQYWHMRNRVTELESGTGERRKPRTGSNLPLFDLDEIHFPVTIRSTFKSIFITFLLEHYSYTRNNHPVRVEPGDVVLDCGACWGDTALYFAAEGRETGQVFSFEFDPENLDVIQENLARNPALAERITIVDRPLSAVSGERLYFIESGAASRRTPDPTRASLQLSTISIDEFVDQQGLPRVDFLKMDIEGSELAAPQGAHDTLRMFRPKLAISLYHRGRDFEEIPAYLRSLKLDYRYYLDHFTIHEWETVLFARPAA